MNSLWTFFVWYGHGFGLVYVDLEASTVRSPLWTRTAICALKTSLVFTVRCILPRPDVG